MKVDTDNGYGSRQRGVISYAHDRRIDGRVDVGLHAHPLREVEEDLLEHLPPYLTKKKIRRIPRKRQTHLGEDLLVNGFDELRHELGRQSGSGDGGQRRGSEELRHERLICGRLRPTRRRPANGTISPPREREREERS